jgi:DNA invertase Pin-like site-specific DNA recombinase
MVAEFESDLIRTRTREACRSRKPKATCVESAETDGEPGKHLVELADLGTCSTAKLFGVSRSTVYRTLLRVRPLPTDPNRPFASNPD